MCSHFVLLALVAPFSQSQDELAATPKSFATLATTVNHIGAHNSPFLSDTSTGHSSAGNQFYNTTVQLDAGVRLLTAQVHVPSNRNTKARELHLCHTSCRLFDVGLFSKWLEVIRAWLDRNANEVVTLLLVTTSLPMQEKSRTNTPRRTLRT
jgi:hypothetical protein